MLAGPWPGALPRIVTEKEGEEKLPVAQLLLLGLSFFFLNCFTLSDENLTPFLVPVVPIRKDLIHHLKLHLGLRQVGTLVEW